MAYNNQPFRCRLICGATPFEAELYVTDIMRFHMPEKAGPDWILKNTVDPKSSSTLVDLEQSPGHIVLIFMEEIEDETDRVYILFDDPQIQEAAYKELDRFACGGKYVPPQLQAQIDNVSDKVSQINLNK